MHHKCTTRQKDKRTVWDVSYSPVLSMVRKRNAFCSRSIIYQSGFTDCGKLYSMIKCERKNIRWIYKVKKRCTKMLFSSTLLASLFR